jgi:hypothetical protein
VVTETSWFTKRETERHEIFLPGIDQAVADALASMRDASHEERQAREAEIRAAMTAEVELRPLNAGDMALLNELRLEQDGASIQLGTVKLRTVELALVGWSLQDNGSVKPITVDTIKQLNPFVFDQIYRLVDVGEGANGSGPPQPAASEPPVSAQDAAESS